MDLLATFVSLFSNFGNLTWQMVVMWAVGALLIYLAIAKQMEPSLLLPMGFGAILVNLPLSGAITQGDTVGPISALFEAGMSNELFPLLLFIGIGAMIDFGPLLEKPWLMLFGAAAQFGIFFTLFAAGFFFDLNDAASIAIIGAADGPTAIVGTSIELFERLVHRESIRVMDKQLFFINPHYEIKFGLKPRKLPAIIGFIPYVRNLFTTSCFYILK